MARYDLVKDKTWSGQRPTLALHWPETNTSFALVRDQSYLVRDKQGEQLVVDRRDDFKGGVKVDLCGTPQQFHLSVAGEYKSWASARPR